MLEMTQEERLLQAWVTLSGMLKNTRITKGALVYNEAIVMLAVYKRYVQDGEGMTSVKDIISETNMLKSLVNRTINSLEKKGLIQRCQGTEDKRTMFVKCVRENLDVFVQVHNHSLEVAQNVMSIIGEEDAEHFVRIAKKLEASGYKPKKPVKLKGEV